MTALHVGLGIAVAILFALAAALGALSWWGSRPSEAFWWVLRAAQGALIVQVLLGAALLATGREYGDELHLVYGLVPVAVSFVAEQLRIASADTVLDARGIDSAADVGELPAAQQRGVVMAVVRRETGVMTLAALICLGLVLRAATL